MQAHTRLLLRLFHGYARVLGLLPYEWDFQRQQLRLSRRHLRYNLCLNFVVLAALPLLLLGSAEVRNLFAAGELLQLLAAAIIALRYVTLVISLFYNYKERNRFQLCQRQFERLRSRHFETPLPAMQRRYEFALWRKFVTSLLSDSFSLLLLLSTMWRRVSAAGLLALALIHWLTTLLSVIMAHYYYSITTLNLYLALWHAQFRQLLGGSSGAAAGAGVVSALELRRCARSYGGLQQLLLRINEIFMLQGGCALANMYLNNVALFYLIYAFLKYGENLLALSTSDICLLFGAFTMYYGDLSVFINVMFESLRLTALATPALQRCFMAELDLAALRQLAQFKLQLVCQPFVLSMYGFFRFHQSQAFSFLAASTLNAIVLMQIDYEDMAK